MKLALVTGPIFALFLAQASFAEHHMICVDKDGKTIPVKMSSKSKDEKTMEAECAEKKGTWKKADAKSESSSQSSGRGGGW